MNKSKVALGVLCVVVTATLAYNQAKLPEQVQPDENGEVVIGASDLSESIANTNDTALVSNPADISNFVQVESIEAQTASVSRSAKNKNYLGNGLAQPADHRSASQPKHHGHEHDAQQRHPEDNSIIPPGEPNKPLPEQQPKG